MPLAHDVSSSFNPRAPRGARRRGRGVHAAPKRFNPRAPRGARHASLPMAQKQQCFNPRAPRGARQPPNGNPPRKHRFQSTRPARGATALVRRILDAEIVSIHAPRAGRDAAVSSPMMRWRLFQSTRPARGATHRDSASYLPDLFQSTRPARGATAILAYVVQRIKVSIHAPRAGRDSPAPPTKRESWSFNPRAPRGARRGVLPFRTAQGHVSIHAPRAGRDASA